jgi:hypothetical protein
MWGNEPPQSQVNSYFGNLNPYGFSNLRKRLQGLKIIGLKKNLYHWKALGTSMPKMGSHHLFGPLKHKLWSKEGRFDSWPLKVKNRPDSLCVDDMPHILKRSQWGLQLCSRLHFNWRYAHKIMGFQSHMGPNLRNFGISTWESWDKMTFGCWPHGHAQKIL